MRTTENNLSVKLHWHIFLIALPLLFKSNSAVLLDVIS